MTTILHGGLFDGLEIQMPPQGQVLFMAWVPNEPEYGFQPTAVNGRYVYIMSMDCEWHFSHVQG